MGEEVVLPFAYVDLCQLAAAHKVQMTAASSAASWLPTYSGAYPFSPFLIFSIIGKDNTFFLNSPLLAQLFLIHARFRQDRPSQYLICHHIKNPNPFFLSKNCNTVSCKNPMIMMSMTRPCDTIQRLSIRLHFGNRQCG